MSDYSKQLEVSQKSYKLCAVCGWSVRNVNGGTKKMREHFQKNHSDLKRKGDDA